MPQIQSKMGQTNESWFQHRGFSIPASTHIPDAIWRKAEAAKSRQKQSRPTTLAKNVPNVADFGLPTMLVKDSTGRWRIQS